MNRKREISCFRYMGAKEREVVARWLYKIWPKNQLQESFLKRVQKALEEVKYDYLIATIEPCVNADGMLFYKKGSKTITDMSFNEWEEAAKRFYTDENWHSELATLFEGDLLKAYKIATGYWSMESIVDTVQREDTMTELYKLYDGFATLRNQYDGMGRQFHISLDYIGIGLADLNSNVFGVVTLKRN